MKRYIFAIAVALSLVGWQAPAQAEAAGCTSYTYLHLECAQGIAYDWVAYDCCPVLGTNSWARISNNRVDIYVKARRGAGNQCRWVIVRGHDFSKYAVYHPDSSWRGC